MNLQETTFLTELYALLEKHNAFLDVTDEYSGADNFIGQSVIFKSREFVDGSLPIHIEIKDADKFLHRENTITLGAKSIDNAYMKAFAEMIVEKTPSGIRIILEERVKDKLKEGHKFEIGDGRELVLDENGELTIRNTSMV